MRHPLATVLVFLLAASGCSLMERGRYYPDGHGGEVYFPLGDAAFADGVVGAGFGDPEAEYEFQDAGDATGPPDFDGQEYGTGFFSMGGSGWIILQFTNNKLVDGPGDDLCVLEIGDPETFMLEISEDGWYWVSLGVQTTQVCMVDIAGKAKPHTDYPFVRITDLRSNLRGRAPGADIDAVGVLGR